MDALMAEVIEGHIRFHILLRTVAQPTSKRVPLTTSSLLFAHTLSRPNWGSTRSDGKIVRFRPRWCCESGIRALGPLDRIRYDCAVG
jgi:hypothetical protein